MTNGGKEGRQNNQTSEGYEKNQRDRKENYIIGGLFQDKEREKWSDVSVALYVLAGQVWNTSSDPTLWILTCTTFTAECLLFPIRAANSEAE